MSTGISREWLERIDDRFAIETNIGETYDRIVELEDKAPNLNNNERRELTKKLAIMIEWAQKVSKKTGVPLPKL